MYTVSEEFKTWFRKFDYHNQIYQLKLKHRILQESYLRMEKHNENLRKHRDTGIRGRSGGRTATLIALSSNNTNAHYQHLAEFKWMVSVL